MKNINFLTTLSIQQQYEIRRWYFCSLFLFVSTFFGISCFIVPQLYQLYTLQKDIETLKQKTKNYLELTNKKDTLKKENELLQRRRTKIKNYTNQLSNPDGYFISIIEAAANDIKIEQVRKNQKDIELIILSSTPKAAMEFIELLSNNKLFGFFKLTSLQQDAQAKKFRCIAKGAVDK